MDDELDTDTLLAILASLVDGTALAEPDLLDALITHGGDAHAAVHALKTRLTSTLALTPASSGVKRKRASGLQGWLSGSRTSSAHQHDEEKRTPRRIRASTRASSSSKPIIDLSSVLKDASPSSSASPTRAPPLTLGTPALVAQHTPCTFHPRVLPPELASTLFDVMLAEAQGWQRNEWWLFDRLVTSPHRTSFYARQAMADEAWADATNVWYNGRRSDPPREFPPAMEEACRLIEDIVNAEMRTRVRKPLEWAGDGADDRIWHANVAGANCYDGAQESVGAHSDGLTYLGPYPTIASLSLGTPRTFRLREVVPVAEQATRAARTFNVPLVHNSLLIMHAGCQERFKHAVPPQRALDTFAGSTCRINITFRFFRPDFRPASVPRCVCDVPAVLRPDMKCRTDEPFRYWWTCNGAASNDGKGCGFWRVMDVRAEGRGPFVQDLARSAEESTE